MSDNNQASVRVRRLASPLSDRGLVSFVCLALLSIGLYTSYKLVTALFGTDADICHSLMLWNGVREHGLAWLRDWVFTQDNWLLSLVPLHFIGFYLFGPQAAVVVVCGWLIFVLSALLSAAIAFTLKARRAAPAVSISLLFLGVYAHSSGFVSYPTSHNITNLYGLASLLLLLGWVEKRGNARLIALWVLLTGGAVSDPWMLAAYSLPIVLVALFFLVRPAPRLGRALGARLLLVSAFSMVAAKSELFGLLSFLPGTHFSPGNWKTVGHNVIFLVRQLGGLLSVVPFVRPDSLLPGLISIAVVGAFLGRHLALRARSKAVAGDGAAVFGAFALFSVSGIVLAFVLGGLEAADYSGRFLINCLYLIVIAAGVLLERNWGTLGASDKYASLAVPALFVLTGAVSVAALGRAGWPHREDGLANLVVFLKENRLTYGYGPYWGSNANAVTVASESRIRIRPVVFDKTSGMMRAGGRPETSWRWYSDEDIPPDLKQYFVFVRSDGEECPDVELCLRGLSRQFGSPIKSLAYGDATILVWNHPLLGSRRTHAPRIE